MKLVSLAGNRAAVVLEEQVLCIADARHLVEALGGAPDTVLGIVQAQADVVAGLNVVIADVQSNPDLRASLASVGALLPVASAELMPPLPDPKTIIGFGMNYTDHISEMKIDRPEDPPYLNKSVTSLVAPGGCIILPPDHSTMVDWEAELAVIIGRTCYRVSPADALGHVFGYTAANDVSARDWVDVSYAAQGLMDTITKWGLNLLGKQFPTFCPLGPVIVTADELGDPNVLEIACHVNGELMQQSNTENMVFSTAELISYISKFQILQPGDIILTGTMSGIGFARKPRIFLQPGDRVDVEIEKIGVLSNVVA
ncbi:fumarylacetoacetate hydrolase family protein [Sphingomonas sp. AP4-R1]|uniref:fumarylacetoacetate hydrolase family protein n=1 Tax=Sphingomonas sp. AP4-R1 TaxID=2735134 RepID=UPI00149385F4|nr:fumarylacetoacetate hydrolase family protein [Sphingomonas sp. AP4-R1]QJU58172.1 fumarylacetoacetate hydrolase family protein [Sphingomonas sp. AP4-R1]